eukprot:TRINITY_DN11001_c0_g1_i2.p1 TRINITY_DN11001_c0_g1~~TRINITY_DN11001_c0_g1_i2.p1  ORF type:complete len:548 (+),score=118.42 TRINITY_DN11001_c0_g1_i2:170-1813(+)
MHVAHPLGNTTPDPTNTSHCPTTNRTQGLFHGAAGQLACFRAAGGVLWVAGVADPPNPRPDHHPLMMSPLLREVQPATNPLSHEPQSAPAEAEPYEKPDVSSLVPPLCEGAAGFNIRLLSCLLLLVVLPTVLVVLYAEHEDGHAAMLIVAVLLFTSCCGVMCYVFGAAAFETLKPTAPPPRHGPFITGHHAAGMGDVQVGSGQNLPDLLGRPDMPSPQAVTMLPRPPPKPPRRIYLIYNPYGGGGGAKLVAENVLPLFESRGVNVKLIETEYAGHPVTLGRTLPLEGFDALCIVGGDGSCHELVNGLLSRPDKRKVPLGFVPAGTGNSVMLDLGTWDPRVAAERICDGYITAIDTIHVTDSEGLNLHSINGVFWGLIGNVAVSAERAWLRKALGPKRYDAMAVWGVFKKQSFQAVVTIDGEQIESKRYTTMFVNNTQHFGKALRATPDAFLNDGKADVCMLEAGGLGVPRQLEVFQQLPTGAHWWNSAIQIRTAKHIRLVPEEVTGKCLCNIDGEVATFSSHLDMRVMPGNIQVYAPHDIAPMDPAR